MTVKVEQEYLLYSEREGIMEVGSSTSVVMLSSRRLVLRGRDAREHWQCGYMPCDPCPKLREHAAVEENAYLTQYLC